MKISELKGLGKKSEEMLQLVGVHSVDDFMQADPFEIYSKLKAQVPGTSLNALYAMMGAQENLDWRDIAKTRKTEILLRLDDLGIAPK